MTEPRFGGIDAHNAMQAAERILDAQVKAVAEHDRHILFRTRMQHRVHGAPTEAAEHSGVSRQRITD